MCCAIPTLEQTLAKIGVRGDGVGTTDIAHFGNLTSAMSTEEATALQMDVERGYGQFLDIVSQDRLRHRVHRRHQALRCHTARQRASAWKYRR